MSRVFLKSTIQINVLEFFKVFRLLFFNCVNNANKAEARCLDNLCDSVSQKPPKKKKRKEREKDV